MGRFTELMTGAAEPTGVTEVIRSIEDGSLEHFLGMFNLLHSTGPWRAVNTVLCYFRELADQKHIHKQKFSEYPTRIHASMLSFYKKHTTILASI